MRKFVTSSILGLSLLNASAYYLPPLSEAGAYFLQSRDMWHSIVFPSLAVVTLGCIFIKGIIFGVSRFLPASLIRLGVSVALASFGLIALKGLMFIIGYDWRDFLSHGPDAMRVQHYVKDFAFLALLATFLAVRRGAVKASRMLSSLGFAFASFAAIRLFFLAGPPHFAAPAPEPTLLLPLNQTVYAAAAEAATLSRRVVWVIFDESDYERIFNEQQKTALKNFSRLAQSSVSAANANSPASATLYSIPSLATGVPIAGAGIKIDRSGGLSFQRANATWMPFDERTTIFGALAASGRQASILGFYHPYCKLFQLARCDSFSYPEIFGFRAALGSNFPDAMMPALNLDHYWEDITRNMIHLLPSYLDRDDALTFVHLNTPHLPAAYADTVLGVPASKDPLIEYSRNLLIADQILGEIIQSLKQQSSRHQLLLIVSSDHWLRNRWFQPGVLDASLRIPFMVWKVGEEDGTVISEAVSTVNTAPMILDYLDGKITTQAEIARWWDGQPVSKSFISPTS